MLFVGIGRGEQHTNVYIAERRWHLDCFRCNQCHTLLDSDANLLLLGDGSLICNNCTYSCNACGDKIEDLAILTGDQAFCAACFRCRNCKRKIENLRYARTSQGIFCMSCHESLMARRRKKSKAAAAQAKAKENEAQIEKSLPALPPNEIPMGAFSSPERSTFESERPTELSSTPRAQHPADDTSRSSSRRARSPDRNGDAHDGLTLPTTTYRSNRHSHISRASDATIGDDGFYIPLALDPSPAPQYTPRSTSHTARPELKENSKDYFSTTRSTGRNLGTGTPSSSVSTPHIAFQANGRTMSSEHVEAGNESYRRPLPGSTSRTPSSTSSPAIASEPRHLAEALKSGYANDKKSSASDPFRLGEPPKRKKSSDFRSESVVESANEQPPIQPPRRDISSNFGRTDSSDSLAHKPDGSYLSLDKAGTPRASTESRFRTDSDSTVSSDNTHSGRSMHELPPRIESSKTIPRKEVGASNHKPSTSLAKLEALSSPELSTDADIQMPTVNGKQISPPIVGEFSSQSRGLKRPPPPQQKLSDTYMAPRAPPPPPASSSQQSAMGENNSKSGGPPSPKLPRWSSGGDFTMDEDMARILGADEGSQSILRRVSNAVRHGRSGSEVSVSGRHGHARSISETTTRAINSPHWPKTPIAEDDPYGHLRKISSPISLNSRNDDAALLRRQLRNSQLHAAQLERKLTTAEDLNNMDKKLMAKRKTVSELDAQTELMIRQLETFAGFVESAKKTKGPLNLQALEDSWVKNFVQKIEDLKQGVIQEIEVAFEQRDTVREEAEQFTKQRDLSLMEFEQLSLKNTQLMEMNNDLTNQIQAQMKANSDGSKNNLNGLGIYHPKDKGSVHLDDASLNSSMNGLTLAGSYPQSMEHDGEVVSAAHVVNIRKPQAKKFWGKKAGNVAKGVGKGFKNAFYEKGEKVPQMHDQPNDNIGMPYNMTKPPVDSPQQNPPLPPRNTSKEEVRDPGRFGIFKKSHTMAAKNHSSGNLAAIVTESPSTLFGSDLVERCEFEKRHIPSVVIRCIQEVELRGMDMEGIYRKAGGAGLIKDIKDGFENNEDYDISDPDIDITAVTSVLKQYFRKLPTPLLTFDIYDRVLDALSKSSIYIFVSRIQTNNATEIEDVSERCTDLRETFQDLPQVHRDVLEFLAFHLARVVQKKESNLMSATNIAVVFAPTIMRHTTVDREMTDMQARNDIIQFVVEHSDEIFTS